MAALSTLHAAPRHTFIAWRLDSAGTSIPCDPVASTLDGIAAEVAAICQRGEGFHILHTDAVTGEQTLHVYRVKWSKAWRQCPQTGRTRHVDLPKADPVAAIKVASFVPVLRWSWAPGGDVVGTPAREIVQ